MFLFNPAHRRAITDPDGPHQILLPKGKEHTLEHNLTQLKPGTPAKWHRYRVESGETLNSIAKLQGVDIDSIKLLNRLTSNMIRINQELLIPLSDHSRPPTKVKLTRAIGHGANNGQEIYLVRAGDTLWRIAQQYRVYVSQLLEWNTLPAEQILELGQKLIVYKN